MGKLPLEGIRVADFGWILATPHLTQFMGTMGAEVIKIEGPLRPDTMRLFYNDVDGVVGINRAGPFNTLNYSKKGVSLDMNHPRGREIGYEIIKRSDILVEAYTSPVAERFGLTYEKVRELKPDIIMLSCSALGRSGPDNWFVGWGPNTQSYAGLPSMVGYHDGRPQVMGGTWPDYMCGVALPFIVLSALHHRDKTGEGQHIDVSMGEVVTAMIPEGIMDYTMNRRVRRPRANEDDQMAPHGVYRCRGEDKWVAIAVGSDEEWLAFCRASGHPDWARDERFSDGFGRLQHREELDRLVESWTKNYTNYEVMEILQRAGVAAGPSLNTEELINDPQIKHRGFIIETDHPEVGKRLAAGLPGKFSNLERRIFPAPLLGQHTEEVMRELLGMSSDEIARLEEEGAIYQAS